MPGHSHPGSDLMFSSCSQATTFLCQPVKPSISEWRSSSLGCTPESRVTSEPGAYRARPGNTRNSQVLGGTHTRVNGCYGTLEEIQNESRERTRVDSLHCCDLASRHSALLSPLLLLQSDCTRGRAWAPWISLCTL